MEEFSVAVIGFIGKWLMVTFVSIRSLSAVESIRFSFVINLFIR